MSTCRGRIHEFIVLAYGESLYLEMCLCSLLNQTRHSRIVISTATPNEEIGRLADKYQLKVVTHERRAGEDSAAIAQDWNAALSLSSADYVTLAHQDDIYMPAYTDSILHAAKDALHRGENPLILFTDYSELRQEYAGNNAEMSGNAFYQEADGNRNLTIKRMLLSPLRNPLVRRSEAGKRLSICLGNPICAPSVTYVRRNIPRDPFRGNMGSNIDWQLWEELSRQKGSFVYIPEKLCCHRIHQDSTTTKLIRDKERQGEDLFMLRRFWPDPVARHIEYFYHRAEENNRIM